MVFLHVAHLQDYLSQGLKRSCTQTVNRICHPGSLEMVFLHVAHLKDYLSQGLKRSCTQTVNTVCHPGPLEMVIYGCTLTGLFFTGVEAFMHTDC